MASKKKLLFIIPHLSTGGLPQVAVKKIETLLKYYDLIAVEYSDITAGLFIVQKERLKTILKPNQFITLKNNKNQLLDIIKDFKPDYVHFEEVPEHFVDFEIAKKIYANDRSYFITETTHNVLFDVSTKRFFPDKFIHVSRYIAKMFEVLNVPYEIVEYPIEKKQRPDRDTALRKLGLDPSYKHILNVGLFTPGKNQKEMIETARLMQDEKIQFHFVGNQAGNFQNYWEPLMRTLPKNCKIWGERNDVDNFYSCMDLFFFTSTYELNPIVIKEALAYDMKILMYNLEPYQGEYNNNKDIKFLNGDIYDNVDIIKNVLFGTDIIKNERLPSKCYITHTTKNYIETTFGLLYSLLPYTDYPVVVFTVNFDINDLENPFLENKNVYFVRYNDETVSESGAMILSDGVEYVDRMHDATYQILTLKPKILLYALKLGIDSGVYLDSDLICRYNIDDLIYEIDNIEEYPLFTRAVYDILLENGKGDIERPLMNYLNVKDRSMHYVQSNIFVFSRKCLPFILEWKSVCEDKEVLKNWKKWAPYHEETIANVLLWKYGYTKRLHKVFMNIRNIRFVKQFESFDDTDKSKFSYEMKGFPFYLDGVQMEWTYIPYEKKRVKAFHGIKKLEEIQEIIEYQNRIKNDFCIVQIFDSNYKELADVTIQNNKEYADTHGYDFIYYDGPIDKDKHLFYNKHIMIKRHLRNYKWIFYLDTDCMIMNHKITLESLVNPIDTKYNIIMENMGDVNDISHPVYSQFVNRDYNPIASAIFVRNTEMSFKFLKDIYENKRMPVNSGFYDNSSIRCLLGTAPEYRDMTYLYEIDSRKLNTIWYSNKPSYIFNDGPKWNDCGNIFKPGDFIIHLVGYEPVERTILAKQFLKFVIRM